MTLVKEFHEKYGQPAPHAPPLRPDPDLIRLRLRLIREEYEETREELEALLRSRDPDETVRLFRLLLKELCDLRYVAEGTAVAFGLPFEAAYREVHRSNMTKQPGPPGGKAVKGSEYEDADIDQFVPPILESQEASA